MVPNQKKFGFGPPQVQSFLVQEKGTLWLKNAEKLKRLKVLVLLLVEEIIGSLYHGFIHPRWCRISSINSSTTSSNTTTRLRMPEFLVTPTLFRPIKTLGNVWRGRVASRPPPVHQSASHMFIQITVEISDQIFHTVDG